MTIVDLRLCPKENCGRPGKPVATGGQVRQRVGMPATAVVQSAVVAAEGDQSYSKYSGTQGRV